MFQAHLYDITKAWNCGTLVLEKYDHYVGFCVLPILLNNPSTTCILSPVTDFCDVII